jgi:hypothetical protein
MKPEIKRRDTEDAEIRGEKLFLLCVSLRPPRLCVEGNRL